VSKRRTKRTKRDAGEGDVALLATLERTLMRATKKRTQKRWKGGVERSRRRRMTTTRY